VTAQSSLYSPSNQPHALNDFPPARLSIAAHFYHQYTSGLERVTSENSSDALEEEQGSLTALSSAVLIVSPALPLVLPSSSLSTLGRELWWGQAEMHFP
jgi:hypothetical protein